MTNRELDVPTVNARVKQVAESLPFAVELDADMGGTFALQLDLGNRGGRDHPHDTAGIDPHEADARWWLDVEGGEKTHVSQLGADAPAATVAAWIAETARAERCPAAIDGARVASSIRASYPPSPRTATVGAAVPAPTTSVPGRSPSHER